MQSPHDTLQITLDRMCNELHQELWPSLNLYIRNMEVGSVWSRGDGNRTSAKPLRVSESSLAEDRKNLYQINDTLHTVLYRFPLVVSVFQGSITPDLEFTGNFRKYMVLSVSYNYLAERYMMIHSVNTFAHTVACVAPRHADGVLSKMRKDFNELLEHIDCSFTVSSLEHRHVEIGIRNLIRFYVAVQTNGILMNHSILPATLERIRGIERSKLARAVKYSSH